MRVSTQVQAQEGDSIPAQRDALLTYINSHDDLILAGEYLDDGISGTKENRDELQRMLSDVKEGKIDLILITKMDRLHRSLRNFLNMQDVLERHHCDWLAIWEPMYDSSTPQGKMIINTMMSIAQFEAENTAQRIKTVFQYKASAGEVLSGKQPFGFSIVDKRLVPNEKADAVRELFEHYAMSGKLWETHQLAIEYGVSPSFVNFKKMLQNPKYCGLFRGNDHYCPAIVSKDLFDRVQLQLARNIKSNTEHEYIFSGIVFCPECGKPMTGTRMYGYSNETPRKVIKKESAYTCWRARKDQCTNHKTYLERKIESYILDNMDDIILEAEIEQTPVKDNSKKITALEKKISRLKELYVNGHISMNEYIADREGYERQIEELKKQPQAVDIEGLKEMLSGSFKGIYQTLTVQEKRYLWRSVIKAIYPRRRFPLSRDIVCDIDFL